MSNIFQTGIRPAVDDYLKEQSEKERDYGDYWSASSAGYCMRLTILRRLGVPKVPELQEKDFGQTRIFEAGHIFHEWMQRITKKSGLSIASEVTLQDDKLMIRGHFDDLVKVKEHLILYDYKTAHSASFKWKQDKPIGHYHKMQLGTYMYMLRKDYPELTEGRIMSISKDDLRLDEKQVFWSPELEQQVYGFWATLNGYWKAKTLPKCTCLDHDGGFMGKRSAKGKFYNDFFYNDEPCSEEWYLKCKKEGLLK